MRRNLNINNKLRAITYFHAASRQWGELGALVSLVKLNVDMLGIATIDLTGYNRWTRTQLLQLKKQLQSVGVDTNLVKVSHLHLQSFTLLWDQL